MSLRVFDPKAFETVSAEVVAAFEELTKARTQRQRYERDVIEWQRAEDKAEERYQAAHANLQQILAETGPRTGPRPAAP